MAPTNSTLIGQLFGLLTVVSFHHAGRRGGAYYLCTCSCGGQRVVKAWELLSHHRVSCGCIVEHHGENCGPKPTPEYRAWCAMRSRCLCASNPRFALYGGRGIQICERWLRSFEAFLADVGRRPGPGYSLDRYPNKNGNYEPGNARWATQMQQTRNTRSNRLLTINGETHCLSEWAQLKGLGRSTLSNRIQDGWPLDERLLIKANPHHRLKHLTRSLYSLSDQLLPKLSDCP